MRKEFELTDNQLSIIIGASRPVPMIMLQCGMPSSPQENANAAWCKLGKELKFDYMSVKPSPKGIKYFTAEVIE